MEPFTIVCKTCAARLKVRKPSLIGQALACPKCREIVKVEAPEGWIPEVENSSQSSQNSLNGVDSDFGSGNFDDIESVLQQAESKPKSTLPIPPVSHQPRQTNPQPVQAKTPTAVSQQSAQSPMLPDTTWTSAESQKRQKLTLILAASAAGLLLIIGIIAALVVNSRGGDEGPITDPDQLVQKNADTDAENDPANPSDPGPNESTDPVDAGVTDSGSGDKVESEEPGSTSTTNDPDLDTGSTTIEPKPPVEEVGSEDRGTGDPPSGNNPGTPLVPPVDPENPTQVEDPLFDLSLDGGNNDNNNTDNLLDPILGDPLGGVTIANRMGELNTLLSGHGATLGEIGSIAGANERSELIGIPKYFIERPNTKPVNVVQYLSNDIAGIQYQNGVSLIDFARDAGTMIGTPFSLHVETLAAAELELDPELDMLQTDLKMSQAIDVVLNQVGMTQVQTKHGIVLLAKDWNVVKQQRFPLHQLSDQTPNGLASFIRKARGMFSDETWNENTTIEIKAGEVVVTQVPQVSAQIRILLSKLTAAQTLNANSNDEAAQKILQTTWASSLAARETATQFRPGPALPIVRFLQKVEQQANVRILIDWNSLAPKGWTPKTMVPGDFDEGTVEDTLAQLARSMGVTYRAVGETTFELMTFEEAASRPELQLYPTNEIVNESLKSEDLMEILWSTVQVDSKLIQIGYDADAKGVVVIAPQSIQRQFESVMNRLKPKP